MANRNDDQPKPVRNENNAQEIRDAHYQEDGVDEQGNAPDSDNVPEAQE